MKRLWAAAGPILEHTLHGTVLAILLAYTYARLFEIPHKGFDLDVDGHVVDIFVQDSNDGHLQVGDRVVQVGDLRWVDYRADYSAILFDGLGPGQIAPMVVERDGMERTVLWELPRRNPGEALRYGLSGSLLAFFFWLAGLLTAIHLRPKGEFWALAVGFNYLAALGSIFGGDASFYHLWHSAYLFRISFWLGVPLFLHWQWVWPRPLAKLPKAVAWSGYGTGVLLAVGEVLRLLPRAAYLVGLSLAIVGALVLLAIHAIRQPSVRHDLRWLFFIFALAFLPVATFPLLRHEIGPGIAMSFALMGVPLVPLGYFAAISARQLEAIEFRVNRVLSVYVFLLLLGLVMLPMIVVLAVRISSPVAMVAIAGLTGTLSAVAAIIGFPRLQALMERRLLRLPVSANDLIAAYAARIVACGSLPQLEALLKDEVLPSLLIRQFAFLRMDQEGASVLFAADVQSSQVPDAAELQELLKGEGRYRAASPSGGVLPCPWIRLVMALGVEDDLVGVWLLGHRDPDDEYTASEIALIRSLAHQTAIALSNILQTERVRELYQANVTRMEQERLQLAHALHDRVLNQLAALLMKLDDPSITPAVLKSFEEFSDRIRQIVADLRPPMLVYGLRPALAELVESMAEQPPHEMDFSLELPESETRYPPEVELHLFRIAQESCQNAVHHAHAKKVTISGRLDPDRAEIQIVDDGTGFRMIELEGLASLIAQKHFGLAGMNERASLIGGTLQIQTAPGKGTRIRATWKARPTRALARVTS